MPFSDCWPKSDTEERERLEKIDSDMAKEEREQEINAGVEEVWEFRRCTCGWVGCGKCPACDLNEDDPMEDR